MKITKTVVEQLRVGDEVRDSELKGFGVRRQEGVPRYFVQIRIKGRLKRLTIGAHGSPWTAETARKRAAQLLVDVRVGVDPAAARDEARRRDATFAEVAEAYLNLHGTTLKARSLEEYSRLIRNQLGRSFGAMSVREIGVREVARMHAHLKATPRAANHALAVLSSVLNWAETHGYRPPRSNPCQEIERYPEKSRERYLSQQELQRLGKALREAEAAQVSPYVIGAVRLLLLTGARLSEILTLRWEDVDEERLLVRLPDSKTGAKTLVLSQAALDVLKALPRLSGNPWVCVGHIGGKHLVNLQKPWRAIRAAAGLGDVRLHDLRHSFASFAVDAGGNLPVIGNLLGHSHPQTTARYAHVAPAVARGVAEAVGKRISSVLHQAEGAPPSPAGFNSLENGRLRTLGAGNSDGNGVITVDKSPGDDQTDQQGTAGKPRPGR